MWRFAVLLLLSLTAAAQTITVGAPVMLDVARSGAYTEDERTLGGLATDGVDFLAVWTQRNCGGPGTVRLSRVDRNGRVETPEGVVLATSQYPGHADVQWNGSEYVVVWSEAEMLRAATVSREGVPGPSAPIGRGSYPMLMPRTRNGFTLFFWDDYSTRRMRLDLRGGVASEVVKHAEPVPDATDGEGMLAMSGTLIYQFDYAGALISRVAVSDGTSRASAAAFDGRDYLVAWSNSYEFLTRHMNSTAPLARWAAPSRAQFAGARLVHTGSGFLLLYGDDSQDHCSCCFSACGPPPNTWTALTLDASGRVTGEPVLIADGFSHKSTPVAATTATSTLLGWTRNWGGSEPEIELLLVEHDRPVDASRVQRLTPEGRASVMSARGTAHGGGMLLAWSESGGPERNERVMAGRFTREGQPREEPQFLGLGVVAAVRKRGDEAAILWRSGSRSFFSRVTPAGEIRPPIEVARDAATMTTDGTRWLIGGPEWQAPGYDAVLTVIEPDDRISRVSLGSVTSGHPTSIAWTGELLLFTAGDALFVIDRAMNVVERRDRAWVMLEFPGGVLQITDADRILDSAANVIRTFPVPDRRDWNHGVWFGKRWLFTTGNTSPPQIALLSPTGESSTITTPSLQPASRVIGSFAMGEGDAMLLVTRCIPEPPFRGARTLEIIPVRERLATKQRSGPR